MIEVSDAFKLAMQERTDFRCRATVTFTDGTVLDLGEDDISLTGNGISEGAGADGMPLGYAISRSIALEIENIDERYSVYSFTGAKIDLRLVFLLDDETEEEIEMGVFTVLEPETPGDYIQITANDDMYKTDKEYDVDLTYPATLASIFTDACDRCGIDYDSAEFYNSDFEVMAKPTGYTFRQIFGMIAMIAGGNARVSRGGKMQILTYDLFSEPEQILQDWFDGFTVETDDITITGISTSASSYVDGKVVTSNLLEGAEGYVIVLDQNPMIEGKESEVLTRLKDLFVGATFRKFSGEHTAYPLAEFMDAVTIIDRKGQSHHSFLTDIEFAFLGSSDFKNSAASELRVNSQYDLNSNANKQIEEVRSELLAQISRTKEGLLLEVAELSKQVSATMTKDAIEIAISDAVENMDAFEVKKGYRFDENGLLISEEGDEIANLIDNTGMSVKRDAGTANEEDILVADANGVEALNLTARRYLTIGTNSRFEDYNVDRTACFWVGGS